MAEIERKWLVKTLPDLTQITPIHFERYFVYIANDVEIRVQQKGTQYEFERKTEISELSRDDQIFLITEAEFCYFRSLSQKRIIRDSYLLQTDPEFSIKIYHGDYEGLIRAEVEFRSEADARSYIPLDWFGQEITATPLGRDKKLIQLTANQFSDLLTQLKS